MAHLVGVRGELLKLGLEEADIKEILEIINKKLMESQNQSKGATLIRRILSNDKIPLRKQKSQSSLNSVIETPSRTDLIQVLLESEREYISILKGIVEEWLNPLRTFLDRKQRENEGQKKHGGTMHKDEISKIFSNIEVIYNFHMQCLAELEVCGDGIGSTFKKWIPFMKLYIQYINNFTASVELLQKLKESVTMKEFFETVKKGQSLNELRLLLQRPMTRLEFYMAELKKIEIETTIQDPDFEHLREAIAQLQLVLNSIALAQNHQTNVEKVIQIKKALQGFNEELGIPGRRFIREGEVPVSLSFQFGEQHNFFVILFSDLILLTKKKSNELKLKHQFSLKKAVIQVSENLETGEQPKAQKRKSLGRPVKLLDFRNAIEILFDDGKSAMLLPETTEEKDAWRRDLEAVTSKLYSKRVFGIPLYDLKLSERKLVDNCIPVFLQNAFDYFNDSTIKVEGIFRVAAEISEVESLKDSIDDGNDTDFEGVLDVHLVANLIKTYFRNLPEPVVPYSMYDECINAANSETVDDQISLLKQCINNLPDPNKRVLQKLVTFLARVASFSQYNKMSVENLGMMFEPNILRKRYSEDVASLGNSRTLSKMIQYHEKLFQ